MRPSHVLAGLVAGLPLAAVPAQIAAPRLLITEFMAANGRTLTDRDNQFSDWIEVHNASTYPVDIAGWHLTDAVDDPTRWTFPAPTVVPSGGFLVVFASAKDRAVAGQELHTNFRLSSSGEYLALVDATGATASEFSPQYPSQSPDVSYGFEFRPHLTSRLTYFATPTPGQANGIGGVLIDDVSHRPSAPTDADDIIVEARVTSPLGERTASVTMRARTDYFLEVPSALVDDGSGQDRAAGDGIWTGVIPNASSSAGQMVRWRIVATTDRGTVGIAPRFRDPNASPEYFGTMVADPAVTSRLPIVHLFALFPDRIRYGTRCSVFFDGRLYDNAYVRPRGGSSLGWAKSSFKIDFNAGDRFVFDPAYGPVEEINLNSAWSDKAFVRQTLSWETYRNAGAAGSLSFPLQLRVNGQFHSVAIFVEQPDRRYLERNGLDPNGALYKMYNQLTSWTGGVEKKTRRWENNDDLRDLVQGIQLVGQPLQSYLMDHVDVPATINYLAATVLMHDNDHVAKNYYLYRDSEGDGEWRFLPWDKDLTFGRNFTSSGGVLNDTMWARTDPYSHPRFGDFRHQKVDRLWNRLVDAMHNTPRIRRMFHRRLRTLMDQQLQPPSTPASALRYERRIAELEAQMAPDVALDQARWGIPTWGALRLAFAPALDQLRNDYLAVRRQHLYWRHQEPNGAIPAAQPADVRLSFARVEAEPASGDRDEEFVEVHNCERFAVDVSGWRILGGIEFTFEPGTVVGGNQSVYVSPNLRAFRARATSPRGGESHLVVGPSAGHLAPEEPLLLLNASGVEVARSGGFAYRFEPDGGGGAALTVEGTPPNSELFVLFSVDMSHAQGCGPAAGLGVDALSTLDLPIGALPFHARTDSHGEFRYAARPGTFPPGFALDTRALWLLPSGAYTLSHVHRVTF